MKEAELINVFLFMHRMHTAKCSVKVIHTLRIS